MDPRDAKIISLSKKNRNLVMALGKERANIAKLAQEVQVLKQRLKSSEAGASREDGGARTGEDGGRDGRLAEEARELREKYAGANTKLNEMRVAQQQLREELRRTQRALQREVGDDVPLQKVIDEGSSWRGRAQEISLLKTKVKELKRQLEQAEAGSPRSPSGEGASGTGAVRAGTSKRSFDDVHRADLDRREADRRAEQERLLLEGRAAAEENSALRKRGEASAARIKALENEVKALKQKLLVVLDKTANDDRLIATLKAELEGARGGGATGSSQPRRPRGSSSRGTPDAELDSLRKVAREQEAQLDRQEQIILSLRDQLQRAMERLREKGQGGGVGSSGTRPESAMRSMQVENERLRELVDVLQSRLRFDSSPGSPDRAVSRESRGRRNS
eukprot:tig00000863_g4978.t1